MITKYKIHKFINDNYKKIDSSIKYKFLELIFRPDIYVPFIFFKLFKPKYYTYTNFLGFKKYKVLVDSFDSYFLSKNGILFGLWEYKLILFMLKKLKKKDIIYDIGANLGFYTFLSSLISKKVYSFEPVKIYFDLLKENFSKNKNIMLYNLALSNFNGTGLMILKSGYSYLTKKKFFKNTSQKAKVITLDKFCIDKPIPTFIKIDIEGGELNFLLGAKKILKKKPILAIEIIYKNLHLGNKIINFLKDFNYNCYYLDSNINLNKILDLENYFIKNKLSVDNFIFI